MWSVTTPLFLRLSRRLWPGSHLWPVFLFAPILRILDLLTFRSATQSGPLAQLVEHRTFNPRVAGSSPAGPTARKAGRTSQDVRPAFAIFGTSHDLCDENSFYRLENNLTVGRHLPNPRGDDGTSSTGRGLARCVKAAVVLVTEGLYAKHINTHVAVTTIYPGALAKKMGDLIK